MCFFLLWYKQWWHLRKHLRMRWCGIAFLCGLSQFLMGMIVSYLNCTPWRRLEVESAMITVLLINLPSRMWLQQSRTWSNPHNWVGPYHWSYRSSMYLATIPLHLNNPNVGRLIFNKTWKIFISKDWEGHTPTIRLKVMHQCIESCLPLRGWSRSLICCAVGMPIVRLPSS